MDVNSYLKRIGVEHAGRVDSEFLSHLQNRHMLTVPFENLDIMRGNSIVLDLAKLYTKIVQNHRGGFCYELNGLFYWLLQELGFECHMVAGRVRSADGSYGPEFDHMAILVQLDEDFIVDVGFGDSVRSALPLSGKEVEDVSGVYRIFPDPSIPLGYYFQKKIDGEWISEYIFTTVPRQLSEFADMCHYQQTSSESHFTQKQMVTISTDAGRITLSGNSLTISEGDIKRKIPVSSPEEQTEILHKHFGITL